MDREVRSQKYEARARPLEWVTGEFPLRSTIAYRGSSDKLGDFSHYTYPAIPPDTSPSSRTASAPSTLSRLYHPRPAAANLLTPLFLFFRFSLANPSFSYGTLPDVQTIPRTRLTYTYPCAPPHPGPPPVLTSYPPTSDFLSPRYHTAFISAAS